MMDYGILIIVYSPMLLQIIYYTFVKSLMFPAYFENNVSSFTRKASKREICHFCLSVLLFSAHLV